MDQIKASALIVLATLALSAPLRAKPVFIAETPGHTRFFIEDGSVKIVQLTGGAALQATILTVNSPDPALKSGQIRAEGIMQFRCAENAYREWSTTSIQKDGRRIQVVPPNPDRKFAVTRPGSFERKVLNAACNLRTVGQ